MFNFLHTFLPNPILLQIGWLKIYWYGLFIALGALVAFLIFLYLAKKYRISKDTVYNLSFYLLIFGLLGDRLYYVFYAWPYYSQNLLDIFKIWQGGLAIHGAMIGGLLVLYFFSKKHKLNPWLILDILVVVFAAAMAIGRFGNYFNQELFGLPTNLPWGIPILPEKRPAEFLNAGFFHPTFLYECLGNLIIFALLFGWHKIRLSKIKTPGQIRGAGNIALAYFIFYSLVRFGNEFLRLDYSPYIFGLRWAQFASLIIIFSCIIIISYKFWLKRKFIKDSG